MMRPQPQPKSRTGSFETAANQRLIPIHERFHESNGLAQQHGPVVAGPVDLDCFGRHRREECFEVGVFAGISNRSSPQTAKGNGLKSWGIWPGAVSESRASMALRTAS